MFVRADVDRDAVGIDRIADVPVPAGVAVAQVFLADEPAVRDVRQAVGAGDADVHAFALVVPLIFAGPPIARAGSFAGRVNPGPAGGVAGEGEAAEAGGRGGRTRIVKID